MNLEHISQERSKHVNKILNIINLIIFFSGSLLFYGSLTKSVETELINEIQTIIVTGTPSSLLHWWEAKAAFGFLQSLFLTIKLLFGLYTSETNEIENESEFWQSNFLPYFAIGMWVLLMVFFHIGFFPLLQIMFDPSPMPSVQISGNMYVVGRFQAFITMLIQFVGVSSYYLIFWLGRKYEKKKYFIIPLIIFIGYILFMSPVFFFD